MNPIPMETSRIYTFLDEKNSFLLHFFEGQKLIHDLALIHVIKGQGFSYFRDCVLGAEPIIAFLKNEEGIGIYVDSEDPYFRLKIETGHHGQVRCLLLPENLTQLPETLNGVCRVSKIFPAGEHSYTSVIELKNTSFSEVINHILKESYQIECEVKISQDSDQSILIMKLPSMAYDNWKKNEVSINGVLKKGINKYEEVQKNFESLGLIFVAAKEVKYFCPCSKDRMIQSIRGLSPETTEDLFSLEGKELETKCDYCKKVYHINKAEILS
jgi:molecular chaperone Hsp33